MSIKFTKLSSIFFLAAIASLSPVKLLAQTTTDKEVDQVTVQQAFHNTFFKRSGTAFRNDGFIDQLNHFFGFNQFYELQISKDGESVDFLYQDGLKQQSEHGTPMKTRDLENPFTTSLQENPSYLGY